MVLFDVYARSTANGQEFWGVQGAGDSRLAIHTRAGTVLSRKNIPTSQLGASIARWLRDGFRSAGNGLFFDEDHAAFTTVHPDFKGVKGYVLFCRPLDIAQAVIDMESVALRACTGHSSDTAAMRSWLSEQEQHAAFMIAPAAHPVYALLLAEYAINEGWPIFTASQDPPSVAPSCATLEWIDFLSSRFAPAKVHAAISALGWGTDAKLKFADTDMNSEQASSFLF